MSWTLVLIGCGARTTLDQEDYLGAGASPDSGGAAPGGSSSGAQGGSGVSGSASGGSGSGIGAVGGMGPAGSVGVGGAAGAGGKAGGVVRAVCASFCGPYAGACPEEAGNVEQCTLRCVSDLSGAPPRCRQVAIDALDCLAANLNPSVGCNQALVDAVNACFDLVQTASACAEGGGPGPGPAPQPMCSGSAFADAGYCQATLACNDGSYYADCHEVYDSGQTACQCRDDYGGSTWFTSDVPLAFACNYAMELCGYPY